MEKQRKTKGKLKLFACGAISGAIILVTVNQFSGYIFKNQGEDLKKEFSEPKFEQSFNDTKEVEEYSFDYYGSKITIQSDSIKTYSFDKDGKMTVEEGKKVQVPVENNDYLLNEYISEREATVYSILKIKDKIKDQFNIYLMFDTMAKLYEDYLNRPAFDTLESRKEALYKVCYDYVVSDKGYTMGGYKYSELDKGIQGDILKIYKKINYMKENGTVQEESAVNSFIDRQEKVIRYELFRTGRK